MSEQSEMTEGKGRVCPWFQYRLRVLFVMILLASVATCWRVRRDVVPHHTRWSFELELIDIDTYASTLDRLGVELGSSQGPKIEYACNLGSVTPDSRLGMMSDERRFRFTHKRVSLMRQYDEVLLRKAGIPTRGRTLHQFFPAGLESKLLRLELQFADERHASERHIEKTVFRLRCNNVGHEFTVIDQDNRKRLLFAN